MSALSEPDPGQTLLAIYDDALASVYGYLRRRVATDAIAEDLASETFLAAVTSVRTGMAKEVSVAWLIGIARHKLLDHYRRTGREQRNLRVVASMTPDTPLEFRRKFICLPLIEASPAGAERVQRS